MSSDKFDQKNLYSVLYLLSLMHLRAVELFYMKPSVALSTLACSIRRQEAAEAGERNSCKGDD